MQGRRTLVLVAVAAMLVTSSTVVAGAATEKGTKKQATRPSDAVVVGTEEFPPVLNNLTPEGNGLWTGMIAGPALARGYKLLPDFTYEPWLFDKDCAVSSTAPFTVGCTLRPEAVWSDGTALTASDFEFTWQTIMNPKNNVVTRNGYDKITTFAVVSPTEFSMVFSETFAPYRELWAGTGTTVLPKHVLEGQNFNKVWNTCICDPKTGTPISSGPMLVQSFEPDTQATLVPNPNYWGTKASVPKVTFVPIVSSTTEVNAFRAGEVDVIYPQNQIGLRQKIESVSGAKYATTLGPQWEHFDLRSDVPGLDDLEVRKAIATAMPRQQIVDRVVKDANDDASVLNNSIYMTNQKPYEANWSIYPAAGDVAAANALLDAAGWKQGSDGVRAKDGVKLSFRTGTTPGNQARELSQQIIQERMKEIGVSFTIDNSEATLPIDMPAFDFDTLLFAWVGSPDPYSNNPIWLSSSIPAKCSKKNAAKGNCDFSGMNYTKTDVPAVDALLDATQTETDDEKRQSLYDQADKVLANDAVTVIPLFQKPTQLGYRQTLSGMKDNPTVDGFTWNIEDWRYDAAA